MVVTKDSSSSRDSMINPELADKVILWMLRVIVLEGGHYELIDRTGDISWNQHDIVELLGLQKFIDNEEKVSRKEMIASLAKRLKQKEKQRTFTSLPILEKNLARIAKLVGLNQHEIAVLEFTILLHQFEILKSCTDLLGNELNGIQVKRILSTVLGIERKEIDKMFGLDAIFTKSSLVSIDTRHLNTLHHKLDILNDAFCANMLSVDDEIEKLIQEVIKPCSLSRLTLDNYKHIHLDATLMCSHIEYALKNKICGVNILLYGFPGTGKTELAKVVAAHVGAAIYEVSFTDEEGESNDGSARLKAYRSAQTLIGREKTLLMYDEAEDIFERPRSFFGMTQRQKNKAWINRMLETNTIPTIWITNDVESIDPAIIRRFDMSIELPIPPKQVRKNMIEDLSKTMLDHQTLEKLAMHEHISPAIVATAAKVTHNFNHQNQSEVFTHLLNNTLKAQGHHKIAQNSEMNLPHNYSPRFINTTADLEALAQGIHATQNARVCLYGPAGTGKSAFGKYLAEMTHRPFILKKGSDLISKWVGETEKNIAKAFQEAKSEDAVLIFDEVDSLLSDREGANNSWEVTQVNEMLVQMENYDGVFIATTNLIDHLDQASLRRFDLKLKFDYLKAAQAWEMFVSYAGVLHLPKVPASFKNQVVSLSYLTPGDFAAVKRQSRFRPIDSVEDFITRLKDEVDIKKVSKNKMGFM